MFMRLYDFDRTWDLMDELTRRMGWLQGEGAYDQLQGWPEARVVEKDGTLVLSAEVPGMAEKDLNLSIHDDVLTLSGERSPLVPEGYQLERQERAKAKFSRSFALPKRVDVEKTTANLKYGILTVTLPIHEAAKPRAITVRAG
ncbi:MAG: Hsp20/alpha crystallin family protein [Myxococcota bacterium]